MPDGKYQLISGERRLRASQIAGLNEIPAYIRVAPDPQMMEMALVENIQREDLNAMDIAFAYNALIEECHLTHEQLSERVGKNRATITNYLRLLNLPAKTQLAISEGKLTMGHARALVSVADPERHAQLVDKVIDEELSVRQLEEILFAEKEENKIKPIRPVKKDKEALPEEFQTSQNTLRKHFQSKVDIRRTRRGKGTVTIYFNSDDDFNRLMKLLDK